MEIPESSCISSGWAIAANVFTFFLGILFNRLVADKTANRKEDRELIDRISSLVAEIEKKAYIYFCLSAADNDAIKTAAEIRSLNSQIGRQVQIFSNSYSYKAVLGHAKRLRQSVSLNGFDDSTRQALLSTDPIFEDISKHCRVLVGDLNMQFNKQYRSMTVAKT